MSWLRDKYDSLERNANETEIKKYTRAFLMGIFGSIMFPDKSADQVPAMYLQFLGDMNMSYNWGLAVLAFLYRQLSLACSKKTKTVAGPLILLQQWAWTRFPVGRPESIFPLARFGSSSDVRKRIAFGSKWQNGYIRWPRNPHGGNLSKIITRKILLYVVVLILL